MSASEKMLVSTLIGVPDNQASSSGSLGEGKNRRAEATKIRDSMGADNQAKDDRTAYAEMKP